MRYKVPKAKSVQGTITVPGDKSISHRAVMFSGIAKGATKIEGLSLGLDVKSTMNCFRQMGVHINFENGVTKVHGRGHLGLREPKEILDAGNSGTTIRLISGVLAGQSFTSQITGDESLQRRPMKRIIEPLQKMGAKIAGSDDMYAPLSITGSVLSSYHHELAIASAQVKSCLMLAGMYAQGTTRITEPFKSRDHSERMLSAFGANVGIHENTVTVEGFPILQGIPVFVPGDISSAAFFLVAAAIIPKSRILLKNIGMNPTRIGIIDALKAMGASIEADYQKTSNYEPYTDLEITYSELKGINLGKEMIPRLIDEIPILAIAATQAHGETVIRNAAELRVKESDRIKAVVNNLRRMGGEIEEFPDGMIIHGNQPLHGAIIDSFGDHRIAMAFAILGTMLQGETIIENAECVDISYPGFFMQLEKLCKN